MEKISTKILVFALFVLLFCVFPTQGNNVTESQEEIPNMENSLETYILYLPSTRLRALHRWYYSFLTMTMARARQELRMVYMYQKVFTGFAARLTEKEAKDMSVKEGIVSIMQEDVLLLHTTRTPQFLGLSQGVGLWKESNLGKGMIIGVVDTGVFPQHRSFSDERMPPPPKKWRGKCEFVTASYNNKLIGARNVVRSSAKGGGRVLPPFDEVGHRTLTSSVAVGNFVKGANDGCPESAVIAAMDLAIRDGVDVISLSVGSFPKKSFLPDAVQIAAFRAVQHGIFVSCSAGNVDPFNGSVSGPAPWVLTVGASTIDRSILAVAKLGNQQEVGVRGKIVLCQGIGGASGVSRGEEVKKAGALAMIAMNEEFDGFRTIADLHVLPTTHVSYSAGLRIKAYINSASKPTATISFRGTVIGQPSSAPRVLSFSSRGPNLASPGILKPDILGSGGNILSSWPFPVDSTTNPSSSFHVNTGTSMASPHLSGIAALLKSSHPDWSPAAIKSTIMTTADTKNLRGTPILDHTSRPANLFATGSGHYTDNEIQVITQKKPKCLEVKSIAEAQLNYPSFSIALGPTSSRQTYSRTVTNVGPPSSTYKVKVVSPRGVSVKVMPEVIKFTEVKQKATYNVTFSLRGYGRKKLMVQSNLGKDF
ncbi:hypothetical protein TIFTF001_003684 [Ficus carica]|uniref:Uncharacterized protein n=1 Tax=Ficus carica TaxID=3494 RepID=A0AA87Z8W2_FICCA|nr:hypothetical protein TIFTF001_003684 [Ficus carica]